MAQFDDFEKIVQALQQATGLTSSRAVLEHMFRNFAKSIGDEKRAHAALLKVLSDGDKLTSKVVAALLPTPARSTRRPGRPPVPDSTTFSLDATIELTLLHEQFKTDKERAKFVIERCSETGETLGRKSRAKDPTGVEPHAKILKRIGRLRAGKLKSKLAAD